MPDVVTYCVSGQPINQNGFVTSVNMLGASTFVGKTGIKLETANQTYSRLESGLTNRFDDLGYYFGGGAILQE